MKIKKFFSESRVAYWAGLVTIFSFVWLAIVGILSSVINHLADNKAREYRIKDLEKVIEKNNNSIDNLSQTIILQKEEIITLKSLPNQDNLRKAFLSQPHIKETKSGIYDEQRHVHYCDNCFQSNPMRKIPLQTYGFNGDEKCPVCGATYSSALSKVK